MQKICDLCGKRNASLPYRTLLNNGVIEYGFCEQCYKEILKSGLTPFEAMQKLHAIEGKVCDSCGFTAQDFQHSFMFGCPDCYRDMRDIARASAQSCQKATQHIGKKNLW